MAHVKEILQKDWPERSKSADQYRYVYLIQEQDEGPVKIGVARNAFWRLSSMRSGNYRQLFLRALWQVSDRASAFKIERAVLKQFNELRIGGEWMSVEPAAVRAFIAGEG